MALSLSHEMLRKFVNINIVNGKLSIAKDDTIYIEHGTTIIDASDIDDVECLVRNMDRGQGTDDLMLRLSNIYETFLPTQRMMQRLSLMQQKCSESGGKHEFCVTCVYVAAMEILIRRQPDKIMRIKSYCVDIPYKMKKTLSCWF